MQLPATLVVTVLLFVALLLSPMPAVNASTAAVNTAEQIEQLRHAAKQQPNNPLPHVQLAIALHELNHQIPDGGSRVPEAEKEYRYGNAAVAKPAAAPSGCSAQPSAAPFHKQIGSRRVHHLASM
jgi:hypothetical protein